MLVAPPEYDPLIPELIDCGMLFFALIDVRRGNRSECHHNVAQLWIRKRRTLVAIGTGYALSDDGLWRQHSWGLPRDRLIETTELRSAYFGIVLTDDRAAEFARTNLP